MPTITTTLAGFGQWILSITENGGFDTCGVEVVKRTDSNYYSSIMDITAHIRKLISAKPAKLKQISKAAINTSKAAEWSKFISYYDTAYEIALNNLEKH